MVSLLDNRLIHVQNCATVVHLFIAQTKPVPDCRSSSSFSDKLLNFTSAWSHTEMSTTRLYRYYRGKTNSYCGEYFYIVNDKISPKHLVFVVDFIADMCPLPLIAGTYVALTLQGPPPSVASVPLQPLPTDLSPNHRTAPGEAPPPPPTPPTGSITPTQRITGPKPLQVCRV